MQRLEGKPAEVDSGRGNGYLEGEAV